MNYRSRDRDDTKIIDLFVRALAAEVAMLVKKEMVVPASVIQPRLLDVKQAAIYLSRSEQSVQRLIFQKEVAVIRVGRRVHLDVRDLDKWIEMNRY